MLFSNIIIFLLILIVRVSYCAVVTLYTTNINTVLKLETVQTQTQLITQWSTITHQQQEPTSTITLTSTTYTTIDDFTSGILVTHNKKRALHQDTSDLIWNQTIADNAQTYANSYNCNGTLIHSKDPRYGENLALGYNTTAAVEAWYDEIELYDYDKPGFSEKTGHFTQVVWKDSTQIGCGKIHCGSYYGQYTICQYYTPGNYANEFEDNVMPLISS